ncbi:MAG: OPT family oligopeptide transporter [Rhodopseudomonas sp.]|nr:OPT family oligopeptide transporter [Rhodopseudomonas sp.]
MSRSAPLSAATRELTLRAVLTGLVIGAVLTPCNVYSGLKIGWSFNMSIAAGLLAFGFWGAAHRAGRAPSLGLLENNINQTAASAAASIVSGGLVAPIPALTILTGQTLAWPWLMLWVFLVSILGVFVAASLREAMLVREKLPFPAGVATAETLREIHARTRDAAQRLHALLSAAGLAGAIKLIVDLGAVGPRFALPLTFPTWAALRAAAPGGISFANLGFAFDPSLLMLGFGAIIGLRAGLSLLIGTVIGWLVLSPLAIAHGWAQAGAANETWYEPLITWLLWPGVTLLVVSSLTSSLLTIAASARRHRAEDRARNASWRIDWRSGVALVATAAALTIASSAFFHIDPLMALLAVALSFILAIVACRVTGETGITPIGALGKVTQLTFGLIAPGNMAANLMTANVTGGAAGQSADLMTDLRTGLAVGATPRLQIIAQSFGILIGSIVGTLCYLLLIPDPATMLITPQWPAPAVATWKAVAQALAQGLTSLPPSALAAIAIAAPLGLALAVAEHLLPERYARLLPSAPALGLALVIPAWNSISLFLGSAVAALFMRINPTLAARYTLPVAAGLVAGESLMGIFTIAIHLFK